MACDLNSSSPQRMREENEEEKDVISEDPIDAKEFFLQFIPNNSSSLQRMQEENEKKKDVISEVPKEEESEEEQHKVDPNDAKKFFLQFISKNSSSPQRMRKENEEMKDVISESCDSHLISPMACDLNSSSSQEMQGENEEKEDVIRESHHCHLISPISCDLNSSSSQKIQGESEEEEDVIREVIHSILDDLCSHIPDNYNEIISPMACDLNSSSPQRMQEENEVEDDVMIIEKEYVEQVVITISSDSEDDADKSNSKKTVKNPKEILPLRRSSREKKVAKSMEDNENKNPDLNQKGKRKEKMKEKKKGQRKEKDKEMKEKDKEVSSLETVEKAPMSAYELMVQKNRDEKMAFLQSLKIDEVKAGLCEIVETAKKALQPVRRKCTKVPRPTVVRKSRRLVNFSMDLSERSLKKNAVKSTADTVQQKATMQFSKKQKKSGYPATQGKSAPQVQSRYSSKSQAVNSRKVSKISSQPVVRTSTPKPSNQNQPVLKFGSNLRITSGSTELSAQSSNKTTVFPSVISVLEKRGISVTNFYKDNISDVQMPKTSSQNDLNNLRNKLFKSHVNIYVVPKTNNASSCANPALNSNKSPEVSKQGFKRKYSNLDEVGPSSAPSAKKVSNYSDHNLVDPSLSQYIKKITSSSKNLSINAVKSIPLKNGSQFKVVEKPVMLLNSPEKSPNVVHHNSQIANSKKFFVPKTYMTHPERALSNSPLQQTTSKSQVSVIPTKSSQSNLVKENSDINPQSSLVNNKKSILNLEATDFKNNFDEKIDSDIIFCYSSFPPSNRTVNPSEKSIRNQVLLSFQR